MNKRKMKIVGPGMMFAALIAFAVCYQAISQPNLGGEHWRQSQADNVREAVFRWQIAQHRKYGETCFLTIQGRSVGATAAFVASHFKGSPFVKPLAESQVLSRHSPMLINTPTVNRFVDARTGKSAFNFSTGDVNWKSDDEAEVRGGGAVARSSGDAGIFPVIWSHGHWSVTGYKIKAQL